MGDYVLPIHTNHIHCALLYTYACAGKAQRRLIGIYTINWEKYRVLVYKNIKITKIYTNLPRR